LSATNPSKSCQRFFSSGAADNPVNARQNEMKVNRYLIKWGMRSEFHENREVFANAATTGD
jgi:hypothetical protein